MKLNNVQVELTGTELTIMRSAYDKRHVQVVRLQPESAEALRRGFNLMEAYHG